MEIYEEKKDISSICNQLDQDKENMLILFQGLENIAEGIYMYNIQMRQIIKNEPSIRNKGQAQFEVLDPQGVTIVEVNHQNLEEFLTSPSNVENETEGMKLILTYLMLVCLIHSLSFEKIEIVLAYFRQYSVIPHLFQFTQKYKVQWGNKQTKDNCQFYYKFREIICQLGWHLKIIRIILIRVIKLLQFQQKFGKEQKTLSFEIILDYANQLSAYKQGNTHQYIHLGHNKIYLSSSFQLIEEMKNIKIRLLICSILFNKQIIGIIILIMSSLLDLLYIRISQGLFKPKCLFWHSRSNCGGRFNQKRYKQRNRLHKNENRPGSFRNIFKSLKCCQLAQIQFALSKSSYIYCNIHISNIEIQKQIAKSCKLQYIMSDKLIRPQSIKQFTILYFQAISIAFSGCEFNLQKQHFFALHSPQQPIFGLQLQKKGRLIQDAPKFEISLMEFEIIINFK